VSRGLRTAWLGVAVAAALPGPALASSAPPPQDPFYAPPASYAQARPGTVLATRQVTVSFAGSPATTTATQVLYRTTDQLGRPAATVATIMRPAVPSPVVRVISYQTAYNGVAATCRPSYALQNGNSAANSVVSVQSAVMLSYLAQGYTVVTPDFEGPTDDYGAGREEGYTTLDGVRATERALKLDPATPVALAGYSGGSIATVWAAQQAPAYAPELHLVAASGGGVPVDFAHNLAYVEAGSGWTGAIPAVGMGLARAYRFDLSRLLNDRGKQIVRETEKGCIVNDAYPGLKLADMLKPEYRDWKQVPEMALAMNDSIMGRTGAPKVPVMLGVGDQGDGGDGVMIDKDVQQLAHEYCASGVPVDFNVYDHADHTTAFPRVAVDEAAYFQRAFAGLPATSDCPVAAGASLDPLPTPAGRPELTDGVTLTAGSGAVTVSAPTSALANVALMFSVRKGRAWTPARRIEVGDLATFEERSLPLPAAVAASGCYRVSATALMQTAPVRTASKVCA
jgi:pimeloyl-ACP methyl ester carboxylesterase